MYGIISISKVLVELKYQTWLSVSLELIIRRREAMSRRNTTRERFTTFAAWKSDRSLTWKEDRKLCQIYDRCLEQNPSFTEEDLVELWLDDWKTKFCSSKENREENEARGNYTFTHPLAAYLQTSLLIAAKNRFEKYGKLKEHTVNDYFNLGFMLLCRGKVITDNLFFYQGKITRKNKKKEIDMSTYPFKSYMATLFISRINDELRTHDRYIGRTGESLLLEKDSSTNKKSEKKDTFKIGQTEKRLREALQWQGITGDVLEEYIAIWSVYKEIRQKNRKIYRGKILPIPWNDEEWNSIFQEIIYHHPDFDLSLEKLQERMQECSKAVSDYLSPKSESLNNLIGDSNGSLEHLDNLVYDQNSVDTDNLDSKSIYSILFSDLVHWTVKDISFLTEELLKNDGVVSIPNQRRRRLIPKFKLALDLYYGLKIEQTVVANHLNNYYPEVAKQIAKSEIVRQYSLTRLFQSIKLILAIRSIEHFKNSEFLSKSGTTITFEDFEAKYLEEYINHHSEIFELVFKDYYESTDWQLYAWIDEKTKAFDEASIRFLELYYVQGIRIYNDEEERAYSEFGLEFTDISSYLNMDFEEVVNLQSSIKKNIYDDFKHFANDRLENIRWSESERDLTLRLIDNWLEVYCNRYLTFIDSE